MKNRFKLVLSILFLIFLLGLGYLGLESIGSDQVAKNNQKNFSKQAQLSRVKIAGQIYQMELADTPQKRSLGLSNRDSLGSDGMVFVFDSAVRPSFWMKDTKFDLDFIWIKDNRVIQLTLDVPHSDGDIPINQLPTYSPQEAVDAMIEVEAGFVDREGIMVSDPVEF